MAERPVDQLTLRELLTQSEKLLRELVEHLDQSFLPKIRELEKFTQTHSERLEDLSHTSDQTIRNQASTVLESADFSNNLFARLKEHLQAIDRQTADVIRTNR